MRLTDFQVLCICVAFVVLVLTAAYWRGQYVNLHYCYTTPLSDIDRDRC